MTALMVIEKDVLVDTLTAAEDPLNPGTYPIRDLFELAGAPGQYKIFWEHVPDDVELPYISLAHMTGGRGQGTTTNQSYSDTMWKVVVHTADMANADTYANAIALIRDACPVCTSHAGVSPVTTIQEVIPLFDRYGVQNVPMFVIGALYRMKLNLGDN